MWQEYDGHFLKSGITILEEVIHDQKKDVTTRNNIKK
jgi:hypothetical protein